MKRFFLSLAAFVMLFGLIAAPVQSRVVAPHPSQTQAQPEAKTFTGTILKSGENFVLSDTATIASSLREHQFPARPYEAKSVMVTGTIDVANNMSRKGGS